jgi:hypothetical protein
MERMGQRWRVPALLPAEKAAAPPEPDENRA